MLRVVGLWITLLRSLVNSQVVKEDFTGKKWKGGTRKPIKEWREQCSIEEDKYLSNHTISL